MKLFCNCNSCYNRIFLTASAQTRQQLANKIGAYFKVNCSSCQFLNQLHIDSVYAEITYGKTPYAAGIGAGLVGVIAGPIGVFIGLIAGGVTGGVSLAKDKEAVNRFNNSYL